MFDKKAELYKSALQKYVGKHVFDLIEKNTQEQLYPQGEIKNLTISFYNIMNYSLLSTKFSSRLMIEFVNTYYDTVFHNIESNGGVVLNLNGDEIISIFGYNDSYHEINAIKSYFNSVKKFNEYLKTIDIRNINFIGAGINSGEVVIGNFGTENRLFYSVSGDHVNLAHRLVDSNRLYNTNIIISDFTYQKVNKSILGRELDIINILGLEEPHKIYEVVSLR